MWPFSKIKQQKQEIERLQNVITKQLTSGVTLEDLRPTEHGINMKLGGTPMCLFADAFVEQFTQQQAVNFLTMDFIHNDSGEKFEVTMQKVSGESLCDQLSRLRAENDQLKQLI